MNRDDYRMKLKRAIRHSIARRWKPLADGANFIDVPPCSLCELPCHFEELCADVCPVSDDNFLCCKEYNDYVCAETPKHREVAAYKMIERLEAIDVDAWTEKLSKMGVFDD